MNPSVEPVLALAALTALIAVNLAMFVSLGKQGDERRKAIVQKASANTFAAVVLYLLFFVVKTIVQSAARRVPMEHMNPIVLLTAIAIIYAVHLVFFKRKYGD